MGKKGRLRNEQNRNRPDMNASVRPVGATNAIGCPLKIEYSCVLYDKGIILLGLVEFRQVCLR